MRAVNLIPEELRPRIPGEGDPRVAYGVLGVLAVLLLFVLLSISYSNKLHTIEDQTAALQGEISQHQSVVASAVITPDTIGDAVKNRTLLVGGLAKTRFPWGSALENLSKSIPSDTTINTITATSGSGGGGAGTNTAQASKMTLEGCTSSWVGYSRFISWVKTMPGVVNTKSNSSSIQASADEQKRTKNCGPAPLNFSLDVTYGLRTVDLTGLPKPTGAGASGATGAAPAAGAPAAATAPDQVASGGGS